MKVTNFSSARQRKENAEQKHQQKTTPEVDLHQSHRPGDERCHGGKTNTQNTLDSVKFNLKCFSCLNVSGAQILHDLLSAPWLRALLKIYECLVQFRGRTPSPVLPFASGLSHEALLSSHDSVAQVDYGPVLPPLPDEMPEDEEAMRIVCLVKNNQPLGATIRRDEDTGQIYIARVIHGGLADRSGLLHPGDLLVEVNGSPVLGLEPEQVIQILINSQGTILFKVVPNAAPSSGSSLKSVYMRAMVDYCPLQDSSIACPDAGMAFGRGDLLEVVDQSDGQWWQSATCLLFTKQRERWRSQPSVFAAVSCQHLHIRTNICLCSRTRSLQSVC
uniref:Uncharacterized protein n=1 Tax=Mola mola TaxID=94237 RepID=A0A3Q3X9W8_MOLML